MCFNEGSLQAHLDLELPAPEAEKVEAHLARCPRCRSLLAKLKENSLFVSRQLPAYAALLEKSGLKTDPGQFFACARERRNGGRVKFHWKGAISMFSRNKKAVTAAALTAVVAICFSFSPVRSFAGNLLTIFRVERMQTITISPEDIAQLQEVFEKGAGGADIGNLGRFEVAGGQEALRNVTPDGVREAVDFPVRLPANLKGYKEPALSISPETTVSITLDTVKANQLLRSLGSVQLLPEALNGQTFTVKIPRAVIAEYYPVKDNQPEGLFIAQGRSPELAAPEGVDMTALREALLSIPALPENLRRQLAAVTDWQHTVLIPNIGGSSTEVAVNSAMGVYITPPGQPSGTGSLTGPQSHVREPDVAQIEESATHALIWQNGDIIYCIAGPELGLEEALAIAKQVK
ncbi:MAG: hypothetical protein C4589_05125 [Peptococcaceae bacterium]|nr:MAG: hypothetical protein C4589_05125 [Peptococcaceae bacterium]